MRANTIPKPNIVSVSEALEPCGNCHGWLKSVQAVPLVLVPFPTGTRFGNITRYLPITNAKTKESITIIPLQRRKHTSIDLRCTAFYAFATTESRSITKTTDRTGIPIKTIMFIRKIGSGRPPVGSNPKIESMTMNIMGPTTTNVM